MARIEDIPEGTREAILGLDIPTPAERPFEVCPPLDECRVAMISSAALHLADELPFLHGSAEYRVLPSAAVAADIRMSHVSINFDRSGFQRDLNVVYPIDRLRELADEGKIGSIAEQHYAVMGSTDPKAMTQTVDALVSRLKADRVNAALFLPV